MDDMIWEELDTEPLDAELLAMLGDIDEELVEAGKLEDVA